MRETKFAGMEYFGSRDENTRSASLAEVDRSQVYVGILGGRYGSGITEAEYRRARERKLPCFIYLKEEGCITSDEREADADKNHRLVALKDELWWDHTITKFANPHDLAAKRTIAWWRSRTSCGGIIRSPNSPTPMTWRRRSPPTCIAGCSTNTWPRGWRARSGASIPVTTRERTSVTLYANV